jgi:tRNA A37 threonylcarbamoyladenosine biosynthesis protein TsaE
MHPTPSPTYERLREYSARRMRMSHVYQPLMLTELLGRGFARQQPAQPPRRT